MVSQQHVAPTSHDALTRWVLQALEAFPVNLGCAANNSNTTTVHYRPGVLSGGSEPVCVSPRGYCSALTYEVAMDIDFEICNTVKYAVPEVLLFYAPWV